MTKRSVFSGMIVDVSDVTLPGTLCDCYGTVTVRLGVVSAGQMSTCSLWLSQKLGGCILIDNTSQLLQASFASSHCRTVRRLASTLSKFVF